MAGWGAADDFLGAMNWLDWLEGLIRGWGAGNVVGHRIALPSPTGGWWEENADVRPWSLNEVRRLLDSFHVNNYGRGFNSEEIWIHVPEHQARSQEAFLFESTNGEHLVTVDPHTPGWAGNPAHGGEMPARWDDRE